MAMIEQAEGRLVELRARRTAIDAELSGLGLELERAEAALVEASVVFDEALRRRLQAEQDDGGVMRLPSDGDAMHLPSGGETWTPTRPVGVEQGRRLQEQRAAAFGAWQQADVELATARVRYNAASLRRSGLLAEGRHLDDRLAQAEAELEQAKREQAEPRDLLANIRERLGLGAA
jgi:multidrug resistance efflux pump